MSRDRSRSVGAVLLGVALVAFAGPVYAFLRWAAVWDATLPRDSLIARFVAGFPPFLRTPHAITWASVAAAGVALVAAAGARHYLRNWPARVATVVLALAGLLAAWNLFTLM